MSKAGRSQGGVIGATNKTSFGKCKVTSTTGTGTFTTGSGTTKLDYVIVAGGGGGGKDSAGGGGAGGFLTSFPGGAPASTVNVCTSTGYPVTIGAGGAGSCDPSPSCGTVGADSIAFCVTAAGGGYGGRSPGDGGPGGSGGGADYGNTGGPGNDPPTCAAYGAPQGNDGGDGGPQPESGGGGGGRGTAGSAGASSPPTAGGDGGNGLATCISGSPVTYAGGGGGASGNGGGMGGAGGPGGGGRGGQHDGPTGNQAYNGCANTGGGGGGAPGTGGACYAAGNGGSGILVTKELDYASGMWPMQAQYQNAKSGTWPSAPAVPGFSTINLLVIAGGGGGGSLQAGGGGAGGYRFCTTFPISPGNTYKVTVGGGGGARVLTSQGPGLSKGTNSSFDTCAVGCTYSSSGGGAGIYGANPQPLGPGGSAGGRGEGNYPKQPAFSGNVGGYSPPEGNDGGNNWSGASYTGVGGGGGGAGGAGVDPPTTACAGAGGPGSSAWPGDCTLRAGGGGGGNGSAIYTSGAAGPGGGGQGGNVFPAPGPFGGGGIDPSGTANTGGGAGGGTYLSAPPIGPTDYKQGTGGSGVVLIQFPNAFACKGITGGSPACGSPTPGCTHTHTFNATDDFVIPF